MVDADFNSISHKTNPDSLHSAQPEEFLPPISQWTIWGGVVLLGVFVGGVSLTSVLKYKVTVKGSATIRPVGELHLAQSAVAGTVKSIEVQVNQKVLAGETLAYIDDSRLQTKKSQLQGHIAQAQGQLGQIASQLSFLERQITAATDQMNRAIAFAEAEVSLNQREYQDKLLTSSAQVRGAEANLQQAQEQWQKAQADLKSAQADLRSREASLQGAIVKRDRYKSVAQSGAISQTQFEESQLAVEQYQQAVASQKAIVEGQEKVVEQHLRGIEAARARYQETLVTLNPSDAAVTRAKEKVAQERALGKANLARLNQERESLIQRQVELENQLASYRKESQQVATELTDTIIRASTSGIIQKLNLRNPGQMVHPGDAIAIIAPRDAALQVKVSVPTQDISKVEIGQQVQVRVSACPYPDYGTLTGTVSAISPDATIPESNPTAKGTSYDVTVKPETLTLSAGGRECTIQSGMEGRADIISKEETALQFILRVHS